MVRKRVPTSEKILNAAEELFAESHYDAVSIRDITGKAGVRLGLAHYHFGSKENLFNAVIGRRINLLSGCRQGLLQHFIEENNNAPLPLEKIVSAFISPYLYLSVTGGQGWRSYSRLVAGLLGYNLKALQEMFDPGALPFLRELRRSMPDANEASIQWGYDFMVGLMCNTFAEVDRIKGLSNGLCSTEQIEDACRPLVSFIAAGLSALMKNQHYDFSSTLAALEQLQIKPQTP